MASTLDRKSGFPSPPVTRVTPPPAEPAFLQARIARYYDERVRQTWNGGHIVKGLRPKPGDVQLRTNDYLALAAHPHIVDSEIRTLREVGHGDAISRVFQHDAEDAYRAFERRLARFMGAEDAVLCMSGYAANVGLIQAITAPETPVYIDRYAHASLWEGIASARAQAHPFRHNEPDHLRQLALERGPGIVVVDALYSTNGELCALKEFAAIVEETGCVFVVDETHSFGAQGARGEGLVSSLSLEDRVHFRTIGLSKAVASRGGAIVGSARAVEFLRYESFPLMFSTSVLAHEVTGFGAALDIIETESWRRERLEANHAYLRAGLDELGYNVDSCDRQILALESGAEPMTIRLRDALESRGIFGAVFAAPTTAKNRSLIRFSVNCVLSQEELDRVLEVCHAVRDEVGLADWPSTRRRRGHGRGSDT